MARSSYIRQSIKVQGGGYDLHKRLSEKFDSLDIYGHIRCVHPTEFYLIQEKQGHVVIPKVLKVDKK